MLQTVGLPQVAPQAVAPVGRTAAAAYPPQAPGPYPQAPQRTARSRLQKPMPAPAPMPPNARRLPHRHPKRAVHRPSPAVVPPGELTDPRLTAALQTLELTVRRRLDGVLHGDHLGLIPGPGSEPGEARTYQPGDDVRQMDWSVTARTTHPHVRQMIADRELETWMVVDLSASLDFGTAACQKRDLAVAAAAAITYLTSGGGNRIGAVVATGEHGADSRAQRSGARTVAAAQHRDHAARPRWCAR